MGKTQYTGQVTIDAILSSNFNVAFQSYKIEKQKFILNWSCVTLGDWKSTGTCTEVNSLQPEYKGSDVEYHSKYRKTNETCSKCILVLNPKF